MINICVLNPNYYKSSGVTKVIESIYDGLKITHPEYNFYFVDCEYGSQLTRKEWHEGKNIFTLQLMALNPVKLFIELFKFKLFIKKNKTDLIHIHHRRFVLIFGILSFFFNAKFLYTSHLTYKSNLFFRLIARLPCIAISESVKQNLVETTSSKDITLLGNPVNFSDFTVNIESYFSNSAVTIGRLSEVKGINYIIDAFSLLHKKGLYKSLIIVGEGEDEWSLKEKVKSLNLDKYIIFVGYTDNINKYIDNACFNILHSRLEGLGLVTVEAASRFKATLVSNVDGSRDTVPNNIKLPNLVPFANVEVLADNLEIWFNNPQLVKNDSYLFHDYLKNKYSSEFVVEGYHIKYMDLINE